VSKVHKNILLLGTPVKEEKAIKGGSIDGTDTGDQTAEDEILSTQNLADFEKLVRTTNIVKKDEEIKSKAHKKNPNETPEVIEIDSKPEVEEIKDESSDRRLTQYDPNARNPKFCGAEFTYAYELLVLSRHAHPSVALFAQTLLKRRHIKYTGNPIKDFTISKFLARFVFRNPKVNPVRWADGLQTVTVLLKLLAL
jgi:ribosome biogenesis protein MAK21